MSLINRILILILAIEVLFLSLQNSRAYFADTASSTDNIFTASTNFTSELPVNTPTPAPGDVVINEINWAGSNEDINDEWLELRNTTSREIILSNWFITNLGSSGDSIILPDPSVISANEFYLISNYSKETSKINIDPDFVLTAISLNNDGEQLELIDNNSVVIDTANIADDWFAGVNPTPKKSMERKDPPGDGTISGNWQNASTHMNMDNNSPTDEFGTPKAVNGI